jgi:intracellular sulfur oxidation DsrE/DsrF family protein
LDESERHCGARRQLTSRSAGQQFDGMETAMIPARRQSLKALGLALVAAGSISADHAEAEAPTGAHTLDALTKRLAALPRRRDFKSVPMILDNRDQWDADALDAVIHYSGRPKQSWDNTDLHGPWLNTMRNALNTEIWGFKHPDFLCVSATHGPAHLALYDDATWEKYGLAKIAGGNVTHNSFVAIPSGMDQDSANFQNPNGGFSPRSNSIQSLQRRGVVFLACHNAIWELADRLNTANANPDKLSVDALCADLTNHLIPGVVLTPGAVGTLAELASAGFAYVR